MTPNEIALNKLMEIVDRQDAEIVDKWRYAKTTDVREQCWSQLLLLGELRQAFAEELTREQRKSGETRPTNK